MCHFPIAAVAALLEARDDLPQMGGAAIGAHDATAYPQDDMQMLRHDDIRIYRDHGIVGRDAVEQLLLHHPSDGRKGNVGRVSTAVERIQVAHHLTKGTSEIICHMQGDVVDARSGVVMNRRAAIHTVVCGHTI